MAETPRERRVRVFLDTTALLEGFGRRLRGLSAPAYVADEDADRLTFEKCVFETYQAFRGIGGKKPAEARGRWAAQYLDPEKHPRRLSDRANSLHGHDMEMAFFWVNQIEGWQPLGVEGEEPYRELRAEEARHQALCDEFLRWLEGVGVEVVPYLEIFGPDPLDRPDVDDWAWLSHGPHVLDELAKTTALPSEDFEIVYAALRLAVDLFVTDDGKEGGGLIRCAKSLGLNLPIGPWTFCRHDEYASEVEQLRTRNAAAGSAG